MSSETHDRRIDDHLVADRLEVGEIVRVRRPSEDDHLAAVAAVHREIHPRQWIITDKDRTVADEWEQNCYDRDWIIEIRYGKGYSPQGWPITFAREPCAAPRSQVVRVDPEGQQL